MNHGGRPATTAGADGMPSWLVGLPARVRSVPDEWFSRFLPAMDSTASQSAVLLLFGPLADGRTGLVITERSRALRSHAGQAAFPGGKRDAQDADLVATALREANEEIGVDPASVQVVTTLPTLHLPVGAYDVLPVIGWWRTPGEVGVRDPLEVQRVVRVAVEDLVDPANRFRVRHPSGFVGPAFDAHGLLVWGFTAGLLDRTLHLAGVDREWDASLVRDLP